MKNPAKIRLIALLAIIVGLGLLWPFRARVASYAASGLRQLTGKQSKTVEDRLHEFGAVARDRWKEPFDRAKVSYPPARIVLVGFKDSNILEVYAAGPDGALRLIQQMHILAASGDLGPKLREGDMQVPEGVYPLESLNPNSRFHVSLRVGYPNQFDREKAKLDGRRHLGGDIMIHGGAASIGCLAVGDDAAEDLFVLAADTGIEHVAILISPVDFRVKEFPAAIAQPPGWLAELHEQLQRELVKLPGGEFPRNVDR